MENPKLLLEYQKKWVALSSDRSKVIDVAESFKALADKIKKLKEKNIILTYVMPMDSYYSPLCGY